jgi:GDP-L-fucose synthase
MPALIRKAHEAKVRGDRDILVWGTGAPRREFLHVDDCADACMHLMRSIPTQGT